MLYHLHEFQKAAAFPTHEWSEASRLFLDATYMSHTPVGNYISATYNMLERATKEFEKPAFNLPTFTYHWHGQDLTGNVNEVVVLEKPFMKLLKFERTNQEGAPFGANQPKVLIVAPLSGHYATLLRDTVRTYLPHFNVYITDWENARDIPLSQGPFHLEDYTDYIVELIQHFHGNIHLVAVCQPVVPVLMATAHLAAHYAAYQPKSMILMGGPIDTRINPGKVNIFAKEHSFQWFTNNIIDTVPFQYKGAGRHVCPGFIMLDGFMALNIDRHQDAALNLFKHLIQGDMETVENHKIFYDEYRAVMDIPGEYYLDSIDFVFQRHLLPQGQMKYKGEFIDLKAIRQTALLTIEGERDDISCVGQTFAAHDLCSSLSSDKKDHFLQHDVGHYGIFNGKRFRQFIFPKMKKFIKYHDL